MPYGYRTRRQLVERALSALGVTGAGQSVSAEDFDLVNDFVEPAIATLTAREIIDGIDPEEVPDEIFLPLAILVGDEAAEDFGIDRGVAGDPSSWAYKVLEAENRIRDIRTSRPTYIVSAPEYF